MGGNPEPAMNAHYAFVAKLKADYRNRQIITTVLAVIWGGLVGYGMVQSLKVLNPRLTACLEASK
jgi:hypothetical protein